MKIKATIITTFLLLTSGPSFAENIYSLIKNGEVEEARNLLSQQSTAQQRDGNRLFFLALIEPDGEKSMNLIEASLNAGVSPIYLEEINLMLAQYGIFKKNCEKAGETIGDYLAKFEMGQYTSAFYRYSILIDEKSRRYEAAIRQTDRFLLQYSKEDLAQWGIVDKARAMMAFDKNIAARDLLIKLSREKTGPGVAAALYLLTLDAAERKRTDDAVFYFNLLREAYPSAIGQDALLDKMSGLGGSSQKEKSADERTGTFYSVQVGVFADIKNARDLAKQFEKYGHKVEIGSKSISDRKYHVVYVGRFESYETAASFEKTIESEHDDVYQVVAR